MRLLLLALLGLCDVLGDRGSTAQLSQAIHGQEVWYLLVRNIGASTLLHCLARREAIWI